MLIHVYEIIIWPDLIVKTHPSNTVSLRVTGSGLNRKWDEGSRIDSVLNERSSHINVTMVACDGGGRDGGRDNDDMW